MNINLDDDDIADNKDIDVPENNTSSGIFHLQPRHSTGTFYFIIKLHINDNLMNCVSIYYSTTWRTNCFLHIESKNRTCGFEGGDCCRNELPPEESLSTKLETDCDPGLTCTPMDPSPYAPRKCAPTRNNGSKIFLSLNHISDLN